MNIDMTEKQKDQANRLYLDRKKTIAELADMYQVSAAEIMAAVPAAPPPVRAIQAIFGLENRFAVQSSRLPATK